MRRISMLLVTLVSVAIIAGCGSGSSGGAGTSPSPSVAASALTAAQYRAALAGIAHEADQAQHAVEGAFHAKSVHKLSALLTAFAADQDKIAGELSALHPPADAAAANTALAAAFRGTSAATRQAVARIANAKTAKQALGIIAKAKDLQAAGTAIDKALATLKKLGYTKGS